MAETRPQEELPATAAAAIIVAVSPRLEARPLPRGQAQPVRLALRDYQPSEGDRVLLVSDGSEAYVVGVLHARQASALRAGGVSAVATGDALEVRDEGGRLLARFADGKVELSAPSGDLELSAPAGAVRITSALDVELDAGRDVRVAAKRELALGVSEGPQVQLTPGRAELSGDRVALHARHVELAAARLDAVVGFVATTARRIAYNTERFELTAESVTERAGQALREVRGLLETHAGRARTTIAQTFALRSGRTVLRSERDTSIDGRKILLG